MGVLAHARVAIGVDADVDMVVIDVSHCVESHRLQWLVTNHVPGRSNFLLLHDTPMNSDLVCDELSGYPGSRLPQLDTTRAMTLDICIET